MHIRIASSSLEPRVPSTHVDHNLLDESTVIRRTGHTLPHRHARDENRSNKYRTFTGMAVDQRYVFVHRWRYVDRTTMEYPIKAQDRTDASIETKSLNIAYLIVAVQNNTRHSIWGSVAFSAVAVFICIRG